MGRKKVLRRSMPNDIKTIEVALKGGWNSGKGRGKSVNREKRAWQNQGENNE